MSASPTPQSVPPAGVPTAPLLDVQHLTVEFAMSSQHVRAVDDVSLSMAAGEVLGVLGESGSGKTTLGLALTRLLPEAAAVRGGRVLVGGQDVLTMSPPQLQRVRGGTIAYVFQEPSTSLNPVMTIGAQLVEMVEWHTPLRQAAARRRAIELLTQVGLTAPQERLSSYPHELSGGMKQRVMIAMAIAARPKLIVADEPTTALDVTIERQIIALLKRLQTELGLSVLIISHNIHLISRLADRIAVMWRGRVVEQGPTAQVLASPQHDYTKQLMIELPRIPGLEAAA
jgi:ABC-type glutathione transport system ATPase component